MQILCHQVFAENEKEQFVTLYKPLENIKYYPNLNLTAVVVRSQGNNAPYHMFLLSKGDGVKIQVQNVLGIQS